MHWCFLWAAQLSITLSFLWHEYCTQSWGAWMGLLPVIRCITTSMQNVMLPFICVVFDGVSVDTNLSTGAFSKHEWFKFVWVQDGYCTPPPPKKKKKILLLWLNYSNIFMWVRDIQQLYQLNIFEGSCFTMILRSMTDIDDSTCVWWQSL